MPSPKSVIQKKTGVREDLAASCANETPSVTNQSALGIRSLSRRGFIGRVGGAKRPPGRPADRFIPPTGIEERKSRSCNDPWPTEGDRSLRSQERRRPS